MKLTMELIKFFENISKNDVALAGGKGASLGEMTKAGISVPAGFVILSSAFEKFLEETDLIVEVDAILDSVNHKELHTIEAASEKIQNLILKSKIPKDVTIEIKKFFKKLDSEFVAVRSSATAEDSASAAWAGQLESYLNITEKNLFESVKKCWASLFTPRAIFYRFDKDFHKQKISLAVVVQRMVESEKSGISFSVHPVTQDRNQLIIEAGLGLGEAIVSGQITPDSYVVEKKPRRIIDKNIETQARGLYRSRNIGNEWQDIPEVQGERQVLSDDEILELSEMILNIEKHYGFPCDIEWASERGKFYIVQSRPITTLSKKDDENNDDITRMEWSKIWTTEYSLFSIWMFGRQYAETCFSELGVGFRNIIFLLEGDLATVFRIDKEQKDFVNKVAERSINDSAFREKAVKEPIKIKKKLDKIFSLSTKDVLNKRCWANYVKLHTEFLPYFLVTLWSPNIFKDMTSSELAQELYTTFEKTRKEIETVYPEMEKFIQKLFTHIAQKEGCNEKLLRALLPCEVDYYIENGKLPSIKILKDRYDYCVVKSSIQKNDLLVGEEAKLLIIKISQIIDSNITEIKGVSAYRGKVRGIVRKVFMEKDILDFPEGGVLVTTMTRPEWIIAMKKAAAFVTDAGGILCHAAIIAREMNKPCIIGTKIATQLLKDGDIVEVDADNSIIRINE